MENIQILIQLRAFLASKILVRIGGQVLRHAKVAEKTNIAQLEFATHAHQISRYLLDSILHANQLIVV
jgi:hypothetical protein